MNGRFFAASVVLFLGFLVAPAVVLVTGESSLGGRAGLWLFIGCQLLGLSTMVRWAVRATLPTRDPEASRRLWVWVNAVTGVVAALGTTGLVVAFVLAFAAPAAIMLSLAAVAVLGVVIVGMDRYAARTAQSHPSDVVRADDEDRLAPRALRRSLLTRALVAIALGGLVGGLAATLTWTLGPGAPEGLLAGSLIFLVVTELVYLFATLSLAWIAGRRVRALASEDRAGVKRVRKAVLRRRTAQLDEDDKALAHRWATAAEPALLLQLLTQTPVFILVPGVQVLLLFDAPDDNVRRWFVASLVALMIPALGLPVRQWRIVRAFAAAPPAEF